jgi:hypothetical protein
MELFQMIRADQLRPLWKINENYSFFKERDISWTLVSNTVFYLLDCLYRCMCNIPYHNCIYTCLPTDGLSGSKHVEDIKIKN